jgi:hypothetical protein
MRQIKLLPLILLLMPITSTHAAVGDITFLINDIQVAAGSPPLVLGPSYNVGGLTVNIVPYSTGNARIEHDEALDRLVLKNAKISFTTAPQTEVKFTFTREFVSPPDGPTQYHTRIGGSYRRGSSTAAPVAANAKVSVRGLVAGSWMPPGPPPPTTPPIPCPTQALPDPLTKCLTTTPTIPWNVHVVSTDPYPDVGSTNRILKVDFYLTTVQPADTLQLPNTATAGILIQYGPPQGVGRRLDQCEQCTGEECATCMIEGSRCADVCPPGQEANHGFWCRWFGWWCCGEPVIERRP